MRKLTMVVLSLAATNAWAWGGCTFEQEVDQVLDVSSSSSLTVKALAGDLEITGRDDVDSARISGRMYASEEQWLAEMSVEQVAGDAAAITVQIPDVTGKAFRGNDYAYVDLVVEVPADLPVQVFDSSGDMQLDNLMDANVKDSSGDIKLLNMRGDLQLKDSSGDIEIERLDGDLEIISDSSGDVEASGITGSVVVRADSSGDLDFADVDGDVLVERDSSGDITVNEVGGSFSVERDGSGEIRAIAVQGQVAVPD